MASLTVDVLTVKGGRRSLRVPDRGDGAPLLDQALAALPHPARFIMLG
jgi:hypothetical protein